MRVSVIMSGQVPAVLAEVCALRRIGVQVDAVAAPDPRLAHGVEWLQVIRAVRRFDPDIVHCHFGAFHGLCCWAAALRRPLVLSMRGSDLNPLEQPVRLRQRIKIALTTWLATRAVGLIAVSESLRRQLPAELQHRTLVVPGGVDFSKFQRSSPTEARRLRGLPSQGPIVLFSAGRYPRIKRRALALSAFESLRNAHPNAHFVELTGSTPHHEVPQFLSSASVLLFTSSSEGSPNILKEALACEVPVVTVDVGDVAWLTDGMSNVAIVRPEPREIGDAAARFIAEPPVSNSRSIGERRFSVDHTAMIVRGLYELVLGRAADQVS